MMRREVHCAGPAGGPAIPEEAARALVAAVGIVVLRRRRHGGERQEVYDHSGGPDETLSGSRFGHAIRLRAGRGRRGALHRVTRRGFIARPEHLVGGLAVLPSILQRSCPAA